MISWLVDGLFAALVALLVATGLVVGPQHEAVVLGTPTATTEATPAAALTSGSITGADFDGYVEQIYGPLHDMEDEFVSMYALMQTPNVTDDGWRKDANAAFDGVQEAHEALLQVEPPAYLAEAHAALTAGTEKCSQGAKVARQSIEKDSVLGLYAAAQLMKACDEGVTEAGEMLTQLRLGLGE